ncbi:hypothetical protein IFM89_018224 [Coptis chinensis]|uniref:Protein kinase domain-containing protein n=1 Tax=Coptis chinensis TaxID=261450 RepID=A0A835M3V7_9MAGN|nr:hypothetical protein IFM89_018224 [Coptis chinensis]
MGLVSVETTGNDLFSLGYGKIVKCDEAKGRVGYREGEMVSLLCIGTSVMNDSVISYSYIVRVMQFLNEMNDGERDELCLVLRVLSLRVRVCKVYGLWMSSEDGCVFLVCERIDGDLGKKLDELGNGDVEENGEMKWAMPSFAMVGMELCEALASLHSDGLVCGSLAMSCFSFDCFGRGFVNPNEVLVLGRRVRKCIAEFAICGSQRSNDSKTETIFHDLLELRAFVSPEIIIKLLHVEGVIQDLSSLECVVGYSSDVWSLACNLVSFIVGGSVSEELCKTLYHLISEIHEEKFIEFMELYKGWVERVCSTLEVSLGSELVSLRQILSKCLEFDPGCRPKVTDVWKCIRELLVKPHIDILNSVHSLGSIEDMIHCLTLGNLCDTPKESDMESRRQDEFDLQGINGAEQQTGVGKIETGLVEGLRLGKFESVDLQGHLDCITGLAVGGGFIFGSSFDKTVHVWSLQNFSHVQSYVGHEDRVMSVVFVNATEPLCISGDSGGGICVWSIGVVLGQEPLKKWYEQKDWRYSGIHALAVSGTEHLYTGSGDKSIKEWSLRDYTLTCTMNGHKSVVSSLAVCDGVLYSGSWDGTIRLWSLSNHNPLAVLGEDIPGNVASVLAISVDHDMLAAAHENGCVKLWKNDVFSSSIETQSGAIFALDIKEKLLFLGGRNKTVDVKEISGDELHTDTRSIGSIASPQNPAGKVVIYLVEGESLLPYCST